MLLSCIGDDSKATSGHHTKPLLSWSPASDFHLCLALVSVIGPWVIQFNQMSWNIECECMCHQHIIKDSVVIRCLYSFLLRQGAADSVCFKECLYRQH